MNAGATGTGKRYPGSGHRACHSDHHTTSAKHRKCSVRSQITYGKQHLDNYESRYSSPAERRSFAPAHDFNHLIHPEQFEKLKKKSDYSGIHYDGKAHSNYAASVKRYTSTCKRPLNRDEQNRLIPLLYSFKPAKNWSWRSLTTTAHSFTSAGLFIPQPHTTQTVRHTRRSLLSNLLDALLHKCQPGSKARDIDAMGLANLLWAMAKLVDNGQPLTPQFTETVATLLPHVNALKDQFKAQGIANQLWALAKLVDYDLPMTPEFTKAFTALQSRVIPLKASFTPQEIANLLWAIAKLVDKGQPLTSELQKAIADMLPCVIALQANFKPQEIANLLWAMAKLVDNGQPLTAPFEEAVADLLSRVYTLRDEFKAQGIANLLWAMAKLVDNGQPLTGQLKKTLTALVPRVSAMKAQFTPQHIANLLWAMAKLMDKGQPLTPWIKKAITTLLPWVIVLKAEFKPQEIANVLWAVAKLVDNGQLLTPELKNTLTALLPNTCAHIDQFTAQHIANVLWAMAKLVENEHRLTPALKETVTALLSRVHALIDQFNAQGIANLLWAVATLVDYGQKLTRELKQAITTSLPHVRALRNHFNPQELANLLSATVKLLEKGQPLTPELKKTLPALLSRVSALKEDFNAKSIANLLWSTGSLGELIDTEAAGTLAETLQSETDIYPQFTQQDLLMSLWGLLAGSARRYLEKHQEQDVHYKDDIPDCLIRKLFSRLENIPLNDELEKTIMILAASWLGRKYPFKPLYQTTNSISQSHFLAQLQRALPSLKVEQEKSLNALPPVDLFLPEHNIVIEIQGPSHYVGRDFQTRNGSTLLKTALLLRARYDVIEIPVNQLDSPDTAEAWIDHILCRAGERSVNDGFVSQ